MNSSKDPNNFCPCGRSTQKNIINVLVVGRTGSGKSTFINSCFNLAKNLKFEDERLFCLPAKFTRANGSQFECPPNVEEYKHNNVILEEEIGSSDTKFVNFYRVKSNGVRIVLIDTPGFADTRGPKEDEANAQKIVDKISKIAEIHAVLWVSKADENRLTTELKYCLEQFKGMLTDDYKNNVFACFTHVTSPAKIGAIEIIKQINIPPSNIFMFENECLMPFKFVKEFLAEMDDEEKEDELKSNQDLWARNKKNFDNLVTTFQKIIPRSSKPIVRLFLKRRLIEFMLLRYRSNKEDLSESQIQSTQTAKNLEEAKKLELQNQKYKITVEKVMTILSPKGFWSGLFGRSKKEEKLSVVEFDAKKYHDYKIAKRTKKDLNNKFDMHTKNQAIFSNNIKAIKAPILYIEQMIKRKAMSGNYKNIHAETVLIELISKLKQA
jgi:GTP-binding protein EngB required for normal cell division